MTGMDCTLYSIEETLSVVLTRGEFHKMNGEASNAKRSVIRANYRSHSGLADRI